MKEQLIVLLTIFLLTQADIIPFNKQLLGQIYQQNKVYMIYVHGNNHDFNVQSIFNSHCFGQKLCAILQPNNPDYHQLLEFIGYDAEQYFLIFDPTTQRKYISSINTTTFTDNDILSFQYKYLYKEIQPFFASEPQPSQNNVKCSKIVGKSVGEFLRRQEKVKVIFLYNLGQTCKTCQDILLKYIPYAEQHYHEEKLSFGYYNTFLNDNPVIQDEKNPSFLIFVDQNHQSPFQLEADLSGLSYFISKTLDKPQQSTKNQNGDKPVIQDL